MQIHLSDANGLPYYQQVVNQVKRLVASGRLTTGDQLLPVRKLAEQLVINPNTVSRAYRELESAGVVVSRRGSGVFVTEATSPLTRKEKLRRLRENVDGLLIEAKQYGIQIEAVLRLVEQRSSVFDTNVEDDRE